MGVATSVFNITATLDPASVSSGSTAEQTFTVNGLKTSDTVVVTKPSHTSGVVLGNARVSAADTLAIEFANPTASSANPGSEDYTVTVYRNLDV